ncbi:MAG: Phosphoglycerate mutase, partial [Acidimicrobiales bacterium]|nr:Phosphoglycerate mutase [Acidimicrobiales bacterium]
PMGERVDWLRGAMSGTWTALGPRYAAFRDGVAECLLSLQHDTVVASHFVAINAAIGVAVGDDAVVIRSLDNCSITVVDVVDGRLHLVEAGHEADTLIR